MGASLKHMKSNNNNMNMYSIVWLDTMNHSSKQHTINPKSIQSSINYLKKFDNIKKCEEYIRSISISDRITLIVTDRFAEEFIPRIHDLRQISSIHIYCLDKSKDLEPIKSYKKVKRN